jgi:hypothetical protein
MRHRHERFPVSPCRHDGTCALTDSVGLTAFVLQGATIIAERPDTPDAPLLIDELQTHLESFYPWRAGTGSAWSD